MCGIVSIVKSDKKNNQEEIIKKMLENIKHRGPDHTGFQIDKDGAYGMTRLSIIDLKGGNQPIFAEVDGKKYSIIFNGEIYNYKEIRKELAEKYKCDFKTDSDTETVLFSYIYREEDNADFLLKFRGMFAFAIYDYQKKKIFAARDFFGIKPFYFFSKNNQIYAFGSEIKSLILHPDFRKELNYEALRNYLSFQYNPLKESFFKNIFKLTPGHYLEIDFENGSFEEKEYYDFSFKPDKKLNEGLVDEAYKILEESVKYHLVSDVPVGTFLSGGVDSGIITALVKKINPNKELYTFTIGGEEKNEFNRAGAAAGFLGTKHYEIKLNHEDYFNNLSKMIWHMDEPLADPSAYALYFLSKKAREKVKVVLSGEGADEFFGGYGIYREPLSLEKFHKMPKIVKKTLLLTLKLPFHFYGKNFLKRASKKIEERYIGNANIFSEREIKKIWKRDKVPEKFKIEEIYKEMDNFSDSTKMQQFDLKTWLVGNILQKGDKMSMANSLEVRVPFLDPVVADFASKIPDYLKYREGKTKFILRKISERLYPGVEERKRAGFPIPLAEWLRKEAKVENAMGGGSWIDIIKKSEILNDFFDQNEIDKLIEKVLKNKKDYWISKEIDASRKIFILLVLALWYDVFFERKKLH